MEKCLIFHDWEEYYPSDNELYLIKRRLCLKCHKKQVMTWLGDWQNENIVMAQRKREQERKDILDKILKQQP